MAASPPLTLMSAQVNQKCRRKWPPSLHSSTWHWLQRLEDVIWFYILFFKSKKRQPSMLSWNDRPIPFTGKENPGEMCCRKRMFVLSLSQLRDSSTPSLYIVYIYIYIDFFCSFPALLLAQRRESVGWVRRAHMHGICSQLSFHSISKGPQFSNTQFFFLTPWKMPRLPTKTFFLWANIGTTSRLI